MKKYIWAQKVEETPTDERFVVASETITENKEEKFTIADKKAELASAKQQVLDAQKRVDDLTAEIKAIEIALKIV